MCFAKGAPEAQCRAANVPAAHVRACVDELRYVEGTICTSGDYALTGAGP